jgi:hypothetical protein
MPCLKNYSGWVPVRRGLMEHRDHGTITGPYFHVFSTLLWACDYKTGIVEELSAPQIAQFIGVEAIMREVVSEQMQALFKDGWIKDLRTCRNQKYCVRIVKWFHENGPIKLAKVSKTKGTRSSRSRDRGSSETPQGEAPDQGKGVGDSKIDTCSRGGYEIPEPPGNDSRDSSESIPRQLRLQPYKEEKEDLEEVRLSGQDRTGQDRMSRRTV